MEIGKKSYQDDLNNMETTIINVKSGYKKNIYLIQNKFYFLYKDLKMKK